MKTFDEFYSALKEKYQLEDKKKKKREDEEGAAPKTGHEKKDKNLGFEDPLADYPEQKRIY